MESASLRATELTAAAIDGRDIVADGRRNGSQMDGMAVGTDGGVLPIPRLSVDWFSTVLTDTIGRETVEDGHGVFRRSAWWRRSGRFLGTQPTTHTSVDRSRFIDF